MAKRKTDTNYRPEQDTREGSNKQTGFCHWESHDGERVLVLNVLGTPGAKRDVIGKPRGDQLKISVTAAPEAGKATDHMVAFLAKRFGVKKSAIEVVFGRTSINKQLRIMNPQKLPEVIENFLSAG